MQKVEIYRMDQEISKLVDTYFEEINIADTGFVEIYEDVGYDNAYLALDIPIGMLRDYLKLKKQERELPDAEEFWKETNLLERLRGSDKYKGQGHAPLLNILDFLKSKVEADFYKQKNLDSLDNTQKILMEICEL